MSQKDALKIPSKGLRARFQVTCKGRPIDLNLYGLRVMPFLRHVIMFLFLGENIYIYVFMSKLVLILFVCGGGGFVLFDCAAALDLSVMDHAQVG
jgi:hypothetical protein